MLRSAVHVRRHRELLVRLGRHGVVHDLRRGGRHGPPERLCHELARGRRDRPPAGTTWGFTLDTIPYSTSAPLVYIPSWSLGDPTLGYVVNPPAGYTPTPASGTITYTGTNQTLTISFVRAHYTVTFQESGLPSGTTWSITFNGTTLQDTTVGSTGSIVFTAFSGTYAYTVGSVPNYNSAPSSGNEVVPAANVNVPIAFTHVPLHYTVTFSETGLVPGTSWSVTLGAATKSSTNATIVYTLLNNSYTYTIPNAGGLIPSPPFGTVTVAGVNQTVNVAFAAAPVGTYAVVFTETGLAPVRTGRSPWGPPPRTPTRPTP